MWEHKFEVIKRQGQEKHMWEELGRFGKKLGAAGLTNSRFGNISLRTSDAMLITCTGSMLEELDETQVVAVKLEGPIPADCRASSEAVVHREIYRQTKAKAIIHCHAPYAVVMSLISKEARVVPIDGEGQYVLGEIPLVTGDIGSAELARNAAAALADHKACIVRGHGPFAIGGTVEEAFINVSSTEYACKVKYLAEKVKGE